MNIYINTTTNTLMIVNDAYVVLKIVSVQSNTNFTQQSVILYSRDL